MTARAASRVFRNAPAGRDRTLSDAVTEADLPQSHERAGIWARLAREVGSASTPAAAVDEPVALATFRCARCGAYCPSCSAVPSSWGTVAVRPTRADMEGLREALFELEPPPAQTSPANRRTHPVDRRNDGAR